MTIFWVDPSTGNILLATSEDGESPTADAVAVTVPAESGKQVWDFVTKTWSPPPPLVLTPRQQIIKRLRADPILKAQVIDSFEARGITDKQQMLAALEAKFADTI